MVSKFTRVIIVVITLLFICSNGFSQNDNKLIELRLSVEQDTIYPNEQVVLLLCLFTNCGLPQKIVMDPGNMDEINTRYEILSRHGIYLSIKHNEDVYKEPMPILVNRRDKQLKYWVSKAHPLLLRHQLSYPMNRLFNSKMFDEVSEETFFQIQNNNYGEYDFQGVYVSNKGDTIVSNVCKVVFLPAN